MVAWKHLVRSGLSRYHEQTGRREIELEEVYNYTIERARREFPDNNHPEAKVRQTLQLLRKHDEVEFVSEGEYRLVGAWDSREDGPPDEPDGIEFATGTYETTTEARSIDPEFREEVLDRYGNACPVSGVDHPGLLDVAHVLPWSDHPDKRGVLENVPPLDKTHHAAFDCGLFTIDSDRRLWVNPGFETESTVLEGTLTSRDGEPVERLSNAPVDPAFLRTRNQHLDWWPRE